jgi:hypothetical protein
MNWKVKAKIQQIISMFPEKLSYLLYYFVQRKMGRLKVFDALPIIKGSVEIFELIVENGGVVKDKKIFEVGTGRVPVQPIMFWLMGAKSITTVDLNPYMKNELVLDFLDFLFSNEKKVKEMAQIFLNTGRFNELKKYYNSGAYDLEALLNICCIKYIAPGDATNVDVKDNSFDYFVSYTVFEHIPSEVLESILVEGLRIVNDEGLFVHIVDYFDHFMHFDKNITSINFLQYSDKEWDKYAGNQYMYMNRMRYDDFLELFNSVGHEILSDHTTIDEHAISLIHSEDIILNNRFLKKDVRHVCSLSSSFVTRKKM